MFISSESNPEAEDIIVIDDAHEDAERENEASLILFKFKSLSIYASDLLCLKKETYVNDSIISFYLSYLHENILKEEYKRKIHIFSPLFYQCLTNVKNDVSKEELSQRRHAKVAQWTKSISIFDFKMLIFPICSGNHWFLIIIIE